MQDALCPLAIMLGHRLALLLFFLGAPLLVQPCAATPFQWEYTGNLNTARALHTADSDCELTRVAPAATSLTFMADSEVLVGGGDDAIGRSLPSAPDALTFTDVSEAAGIFEDNISWGAAWGDYDRDGYIDVMTVGHLNSICQLWHNNGDGTFTDVTTAAGLPMVDGDAHGPSWADLDNDGYLDLYVAKGTTKDDPISYNDLWRNNGYGTFTNIAVSSNVTGIGSRSRGSYAVDYDNDGDLDLFVASTFLQATLQAAFGERRQYRARKGRSLPRDG